MRARLWPTFFLVSLLAVPAAAQPVEGRGHGVDAFAVSVGVWDAYEARHAGGVLTLDLSWDAFLLATDYDMTLYRPGALDDGALTQDEVVARAWTHARTPREEHLALTLPPGDYVVTVEPIHSDGQAYRLDSNAQLRLVALSPGIKFGF